jgi:hypothetical protein
LFYRSRNYFRHETAENTLDRNYFLSDYCHWQKMVYALDMTTMTVFHGGLETVSEIRVGGNSNVFDGIFCSYDRNAARSHGPVVTEIELDSSEILTQQKLGYHCDSDEIATIRATVARKLRLTDDAQIDRAIEIIIDDASCTADDSDIAIFRADDAGQAGWEAQRVRGHVARALGFSAVEMDDEHGSTLLIVAFE